MGSDVMGWDGMGWDWIGLVWIGLARIAEEFAAGFARQLFYVTQISSDRRPAGGHPPTSHLPSPTSHSRNSLGFILDFLASLPK